MADRKITDLTALAAGSQATGDLLTIVDVSEGAAADKNKKITVESLLKGIPGNVGIGTSSPSQLLHLQSSDPSVQITRTGSHVARISAPAGGGLSIGADGSDGSTVRFRINNSGNVGIGTSSPGSKLEVSGGPVTLRNGASSFPDGISAPVIYGSTGGGSGTFNESGNLVLQSRSDAGSYNICMVTGDTPAERMHIDSSGRLLVGTTTSQAHAGANLVEIGNYTLTNAGITINSPTNGAGLINFGDSSSSNRRGRIEYNHTADAFRFYTADSERMRIDNSGNVGIGTTSPVSPLVVSKSGGEGFEVVPGQSSDLNLFYNYNRGSNTYIDYRVFANTHQFYKQGSTEAMRIDSGGRVLIGTTSNQGGHLFQVKGGDASLTKLAEASGGNAVHMLRFRVHNSNNQAQDASLAGISAETVSSWGGSLTFHTKDNNGSPNETLTERARLDNDGNFLVGKNELSDTTEGLSMRVGGVVAFEATVASGAAHCMMMNRQGDDGTYVKFRQPNSLEGTITVSGSTVSYNGGHLARWSQLPSGAARTEILRGSVLSNLNEMCEWDEEENEQLNRMKISDVEGDINVAGVFQAWDDDDDTYTNDFYCAMTGDFVIRIASGVTVQRGNLLMSAGDGTAKPQGDGYIQDKTIAKVTSTTVSTTYSDGSYCVPCVLMAC